MNEKRFYHLALEAGLLDGTRLKRRIDRQIGAAAPTQQTRKSSRPRWWITIPATVAVAVAALAIVLTAGLIVRTQTRGAASASPTAQPTAEPTLNLVNESTVVKLLDEFDPALQAECTDWRMGQNGDPFREADWAWLRDTQVETLSVYQGDDRLTWSIRLKPSQFTPFHEIDPTPGKQSVEFNLWKASYRVDDGAWLPFDGVFNDTLPSEDMETGTLYRGWYCDPTLPETGRITVQATYCVVDTQVEDMIRYFGSVALIEQTFSFNAEALRFGARHIPIPLSGERILTERTGENTFINRPYSLDGVVLDCVVYDMEGGLEITFEIASAPDTWTEEDRQQLLNALPGRMSNTMLIYTLTGYATPMTAFFRQTGTPLNIAVSPLQLSFPQEERAGGELAILPLHTCTLVLRQGDVPQEGQTFTVAGTEDLAFYTEPLCTVEIPLQ